jgi:hypothetical protein
MRDSVAQAMIAHFNPRFPLGSVPPLCPLCPLW